MEGTSKRDSNYCAKVQQCDREDKYFVPIKFAAGTGYQLDNVARIEGVDFGERRS